MINALHTHIPSRVLLEIGGLSLYWYGFLYVVALVLGLLVTRWIAHKKRLDVSWLLDLALLLFLSGIIGARLWYVLFIEPSYFLLHPETILALWNGGLALHGGLVGALLALFIFAKRKKKNLLALSDLLAPALILGQAIGRWGNYFNQELYGRPTNLPWGIPIALGDGAVFYAHPTFLYESLGNSVIFLVLLSATLRWKNARAGTVTALYLFLYSLLRFTLEFLRVDPTPTALFRFPQWISLALIVASLVFFLTPRRRTEEEL